MKGIMLRTNERTSDRFERLCEHLDALDTAEDMDRVFKHLVFWYLRWGGDEDLDAGVWFDLTSVRIGRWSEFESAKKFGNGLEAAGYIQSVESYFPEDVLKGRTGYFVPGHINDTWRTIHSRRANAGDLVPFITDRGRRASAAKSCGIPAGAFGDWLEPPPTGYVSHGVSHDATHDVSHDVAQHVSQDAAHPVSHPPLRLNVKEKNEVKQRIRSQSEGRMDGRTGFHKTEGQLAFIREHKYQNPLECLKRLDDGRVALKTWHQAIKADPESVRQKLAEITETDASWLQIGNPAALMMKLCKNIIRGDAA